MNEIHKFLVALEKDFHLLFEVKEGAPIAEFWEAYDRAVEESAQQSVQRIGGTPCPECGKLGGSHLWSCSIGNSANR